MATRGGSGAQFSQVLRGFQDEVGERRATCLFDPGGLRQHIAVAMKGIDDEAAASERMEDIIDHGCRVITEIQDHGPYTLIGYSFGGVVAIEIARRLSARDTMCR
jgi:pimeloyl-ACP methyl ester carboxylesterase